MITRFDAVAVGLFLILTAEIIMLIRRVPPKRNLINVVFSVYIVFLVSIVFFPLLLTSDGTNVGYNFIPFASIKNYLRINRSYSTLALIGNLALLMPWGMLFKVVFQKSKSLAFWLSTVAFCMGIEVTQHLINVMLGYKARCVDIDDFILNMTGAVIGFIIFRFCLIKIYKLLKK